MPSLTHSETAAATRADVPDGWLGARLKTAVIYSAG